MAEVRFDNIKAMMEKYGPELVTQVITQLNSIGKQASGNLARSIDHEIVLEEGKVSLEIMGADYWKYVDEGRKPGSYAPVSALERWAKMKGIPASAVFAINRKIYRKGIKATNFSKAVLTRTKSKFEELVKQSYEQDIIDNMDEIATQLSD